MKTKIVQIRMERSDVDKIKKLAKRENINFSEYIRQRLYAPTIIEEKLNKILKCVKMEEKDE
jgi:predicted DNA binding CopG/RHH family protein